MPSGPPAPAARHAGFHETARGGLAARLLGERLVRLWPSVEGLAVLGVGYPFPYLSRWPAEPARPGRGPGRIVAATLGRVPGAAPAPAGLGWVCAADHAALPFPDLLFDRVLLVHGLELAGNGRRLLREAWRVLKDDGRLLLVAPNRRGAWAHLESTPFGHGQPYSRGQLDRLLARHAFHVERRDTALFVPPLPGGLVAPGARLADAIGRRLLPEFGGVTITEAVKDLFGAVPVMAAQSIRTRLPRRVLIEASSSIA